MIYRLIRTIVFFMSHIPLPLGRFLGKMLGTAFCMIPALRASIVLENIQRAFVGTERGAHPKRLLRKIFMHFGQMLFEVPHILKMTPENLERFVVFQGLKNFTAAAAKGKGVFILTAHFGNWELMSAALSIYLGNASIVVRPIDFEPFERSMQDLRTRFGTEIIPKQKGMRKILQAMKRRRVVGILLDQNVDWYEGVFVNFLGRLACTNKGLALLALKTGAPVVPVFSVRQRDGRFRVIFEPEIDLIRTGAKIPDIEENTALFTSVIEKYIRHYPDHWFWFHRRWKTIPFCRLPATYFAAKKEPQTE